MCFIMHNYKNLKMELGRYTKETLSAKDTSHVKCSIKGLRVSDRTEVKRICTAHLCTFGTLVLNEPESL